MRASGILMPVFSLPGPFGIGTLGSEATAFVDFLAEAKQTYWHKSNARSNNNNALRINMIKRTIASTFAGFSFASRALNLNPVLNPPPPDFHFFLYI